METSILGMKPFSHSAFARFTSAFEEILRADTRAGVGPGGILRDPFVEGLHWTV